jgi:hypothetical protein
MQTQVPEVELKIICRLLNRCHYGCADVGPLFVLLLFRSLHFKVHKTAAKSDMHLLGRLARIMTVEQAYVAF